MGKAGRWLRSFLLGRREKKEKAEPSTPVSGPAPKEKRRWSFHRTESGKNLTSPDSNSPMLRRLSGSEIDRRGHAMAVAAATTAAVEAFVAAAQAAATARPAARLTATTTGGTDAAVEEAAAIKIQTIFRSYLARKALCALKGLVKLQAMVRGHLVRKQATDTLRCMQSLVMAQARARAHRIRMVEPIHRRPNDPRFHQSYEVDRSLEENIKIVEMDHGESRGISKGRNSYSIAQIERKDHNLSAYYCDVEDGNQQFTTAPSAFTDISSRGYDENFDDFSSETTKSKPQYLSAVSVPDATQASFENTLFPNYMSNTESSRAKARSNSTPKQRPDAYERQTSRRREPVEGRNIPRGAKMQRSSSHAGSALVGYQYPCSTKLDKSGMSLKGSECGSTSIVVTDTKYGRPQAAYEVRMY